MTRRAARSICLGGVVALLALCPAAGASTHILRPASTAASGQWSVVPAGSDVAASLADDIAQPAAPDTGTGFITSPAKGNSLTAVTISAPALATGENITGATAWVYLSTGSSRSATVALATSTTVLGTVSVPAGRSAQWVSVPTSVAPTAAQLAGAYLVIAPGGNTGSAVNAYAAYVDLETDAPDPSTGSADGSSTAGSSPSGTTAVGGDGALGGADASLAATVAHVAALVARPTDIVSVPIVCPVVQLSGCAGRVTIELLGPYTRSAARRMSAARRRKVVLRSTRRFKVAAGTRGRVPVVLDRRTARVLHRRGRARARITVTTDLGDGKRAVAVRTLNLRARRTARPTPRVVRRGGTRH
jgi:hypothetical protein